jgi:spectinomycin phosphotransferase
MLDKPTIPNTDIIAILHTHYGLDVAQLIFLPIGADPNAAVFRVKTTQADYFLKFTRRDFDAMTLLVPSLLRAQNIPQVIAPITTRTQQLSTRLQDFNLILYPYVDSTTEFIKILTPPQWREFGTALARIHTMPISPDLHQNLHRETYSPYWRNIVITFYENMQTKQPQDPLLQALAMLMKNKQPDIMYLVTQAQQQASILENLSLEFVLCHADIHVGNVLIDEQGHLFIVDWDEIILAPKERDLMFIGAGIGGIWNTPEEAGWFWEGYGQAVINPNALVYYLHERIVQDIAVTIIEMNESGHSDENRHIMLNQLEGQFQPNSVIDIARKTATSLLFT